MRTTPVTSTAREKKKSLSPRTKVTLALIQGLLPTLTAIVGGLWIVYTYLDQQSVQAEKEHHTRLIEAKKPFLDRQLAMYIETAKVTGKLVSEPDPLSESWKQNYTRFKALYWTELAMVEDDNVKKAMEDFAVKLVATKKDATVEAFHELSDSSFFLAVALKESLSKSWDINLGSANAERPDIPATK